MTPEELTAKASLYLNLCLASTMARDSDSDRVLRLLNRLGTELGLPPVVLGQAMGDPIHQVVQLLESHYPEPAVPSRLDRLRAQLKP